MERTFRIIQWLCALALGAVFIYAAVVKIAQPDVFLKDIQSYRILDYQLAYLSAYFLPAFELVCGIAVLVPKLWRISASLIAAMMGVFIVALLSAWIRGLDITCGCFGESDNKANYPWLIIRDLMLLGACVPLIFKKRLESRF